MVSLFPWLAVEDKLAFHSVGDICAQLSSQTLPRLKPRFLKQMDGLDIDQFIHAVFPALADVEPILKSSEREAANCVRLVGELFRQIDVNGDGKVDWEEFTNFTIAVGTGSSTSKGGTTADEFEIRYILDEGHIRTSQKHKSIHRMHCAHALKSRIFVIRKETNGFECWDRLARFEHDFYFPKIGEGKEEIQLDGYVHDIHYVPEKKSLVVRSPRFEVLRCLHFLGWTRGHLTMPGVVSFSSLRPFRAGRALGPHVAPHAGGFEL